MPATHGKLANVFSLRPKGKEPVEPMRAWIPQTVGKHDHQGYRCSDKDDQFQGHTVSNASRASTSTFYSVPSLGPASAYQIG